MEKDFRKEQKILATIELEDKMQDFTELDVLENGVILGDSVMFRNGRLSLLGIGTLNGTKYFDFQELKNENTFLKKSLKVKGLFVYFYSTDKKKPVPWEAGTFKYRVTKIKKAMKPNRFIKK